MERRNDEIHVLAPSKIETTLPIAIASTFTADALRRPLEFWMEALGIPPDVALAPYAQIMQELLSPQSVASPASERTAQSYLRPPHHPTSSSLRWLARRSRTD